MASLSLLIFDLDGTRFALDATRVRESVWLPELTPAEEAPPWIVGLFSLRGRIVAVADLRLRLGHPAQRYSPSDQVVVLEAEPLPMGLIVSEVIGVIELAVDAIQAPPQFEAAAPGNAHLVAGEARAGDGLVTLLDVSRLTQLPRGWRSPKRRRSRRRPAISARTPRPPSAPCSTPGPWCCERLPTTKTARAWPGGGGTGRRVLRRRTGDRAGILRHRPIEPVPCCPPHILGAMSLRGNLVTLIDPRAALGLPPAARGGKAVVARLGEQAMGFAVDAVHDVVI